MRSCIGAMDVLLVSKEMKIKALSGHNIVQYHWLECHGTGSGNKVCCSCIYNLFAWYEWKKDNLILYSHQASHTETELRLCMFKKEHCFGHKLDLQYEPVSKLIYFICFVTNLNVIQFKQLEKGFILSRFSLLCFCEYTIISLAMIPTILTLTPAMEISLWES